MNKELQATIIPNGCQVVLSKYSKYYGRQRQIPVVGTARLRITSPTHIYWAYWDSGHNNYCLKDLLPVG